MSLPLWLARLKSILVSPPLALNSDTYRLSASGVPTLSFRVIHILEALVFCLSKAANVTF